MRETIEFNPTFSTLTLHMEPGETVKAEPGAMIAMSGTTMTTTISSIGMIRNIKRLMGSESFFVNTFHAEQPDSWVALAPSIPGDIKPFDLTPQDGYLYIQGSSFLAAVDDIVLDAKFQGVRNIFAGEKIFFIRASAEQNRGRVYCNSYGAIQELHVRPGQELIVDTRHLVAYTDQVEYRVGKVSGIRPGIAGGEGLVMKFTGQGSVWIQTRCLSSLADHIYPFLPRKV